MKWLRITRTSRKAMELSGIKNEIENSDLPVLSLSVFGPDADVFRSLAPCNIKVTANIYLTLEFFNG